MKREFNFVSLYLVTYQTVTQKVAVVDSVQCQCDSDVVAMFPFSCFAAMMWGKQRHKKAFDII